MPAVPDLVLDASSLLLTVPGDACNPPQMPAGTAVDCFVTVGGGPLDVASKCQLAGSTLPLCTSIPGAAINVAPQTQSCFVNSGHYQGDGRCARNGDPASPCGSTPKAYPGSLLGTTQDVVVFTLRAPPAGTCVTVTFNGGTCVYNHFMSLWSGEFPLGTTPWPSTGTVGGAVFQNDPGSSGSTMTAPFTMPSGGIDTFSIVLSTSSGVSSCTYGDISITYS